jgi:hypothetical protein
VTTRGELISVRRETFKKWSVTVICVSGGVSGGDRMVSVRTEMAN